MPRYLFFISYMGTRFRGIQRQLPHNLEDLSTVQGCIEIGLQTLKPLNKPIISTASRTDKGVHALKSACHADLLTEKGRPYDPYVLAYRLNKYFSKSSIGIWIQHCQQVPDTFNCRRDAIKRTYLYRLAVRRKDAPAIQRNFLAQIPFAEWRRCHFIVDPKFDTDKFKETAPLFLGIKDFRTFMGSVRNTDGEEINTVRELFSFDISPGQPLVPPQFCEATSYYDFYNITISSKSFLFRQVRRMVGALVAVADGRIDQQVLESMFAEPSADSWTSRVTLVPPYGLYLASIEYDPKHLILPEGTVTVNDLQGPEEPEETIECEREAG